MADKEVEADDPMALVGVELPAATDAELVEMTDSFIEEFARLGWSAEKVLLMFRTPFYAAAHRIYLSKGEAFVRERIEEAAVLFEACQSRVEPRGAHVCQHAEGAHA